MTPHPPQCDGQLPVCPERSPDRLFIFLILLIFLSTIRSQTKTTMLVCVANPIPYFIEDIRSINQSNFISISLFMQANGTQVPEDLGSRVH